MGTAPVVLLIAYTRRRPEEEKRSQTTLNQYCVYTPPSFDEIITPTYVPFYARTLLHVRICLHIFASR